MKFHHWLSAVALTAIAAAPAAAQDYAVLVTPGEQFGVDDEAFQDLVEESAYLTEDFGGFVVTRWYQAPDRTTRAIAPCAADTSCYVDALFDSGFDYTLVVSAYDEGTEIVVEYQMIDMRVGIQAAATTAFLPTVTDFAYLLVPCHDALKVTPTWIAPPPIVAPPPPPPVAVAPPPPPEPRLGRLGRIGAATAGGGGALLVGGVLLGFGADETQQEIQAEPHPRGELRSLQSRGERQQRFGNALMIVGGAAIVGGVTLVIIDGRADDEPEFSMGATPGQVWLRTRF